MVRLETILLFKAEEIISLKYLWFTHKVLKTQRDFANTHGQITCPLKFLFYFISIHLLFVTWKLCLTICNLFCR
jgi:hypothetical protein